MCDCASSFLFALVGSSQDLSCEMTNSRMISLWCYARDEPSIQNWLFSRCLMQVFVKTLIRSFMKYSSWRSLWIVLHHKRRTCVLLPIPSNMQVLSIGMYCLVMILMTSWEIIPPERAEMLCNSPPLARATSSAALDMRGLDEASEIDLLIVARISNLLAAGAWAVAPRAR